MVRAQDEQGKMLMTFRETPTRTWTLQDDAPQGLERPGQFYGTVRIYRLDDLFPNYQVRVIVRNEQATLTAEVWLNGRGWENVIAIPASAWAPRFASGHLPAERKAGGRCKPRCCLCGAACSRRGRPAEPGPMMGHPENYMNRFLAVAALVLAAAACNSGGKSVSGTDLGTEVNHLEHGIGTMTCEDVPEVKAGAISDCTDGGNLIYRVTFDDDQGHFHVNYSAP